MPRLVALDQGRRSGDIYALSASAAGNAKGLPMKCFQHNERDAVGTCAGCGGAGCRECLVHYAGAKLCPACAVNAYEQQRASIAEQGDYARKKLRRALFVSAFFGCGGFLFWGGIGVDNGIFTGLLSGVFGGLWNAYGWGTTYLGAIPFVRFWGSRIFGGAVSSSPTGALFGAVWFWIVAGWWLFFLGSIFAFFGGGIYHLFKLIQMTKQSDRDLRSLPPPMNHPPALAA